MRGFFLSGFRIGVSPLQDLSPILLAGSELFQRQNETPAEGRGLGFDQALITWCTKRLGRSGLDGGCERLLRGMCCSARGGRSARHKLWVKLLELRRSDLCREEQSWLVPQKIPSPRSVAWSVCAPSKGVNVV